MHAFKEESRREREREEKKQERESGACALSSKISSPEKCCADVQRRDLSLVFLTKDVRATRVFQPTLAGLSAYLRERLRDEGVHERFSFVEYAQTRNG